MGIHGMKRLQAQKHQSMHRNLNIAIKIRPNDNLTNGSDSGWLHLTLKRILSI